MCQWPDSLAACRKSSNVFDIDSHNVQSLKAIPGFQRSSTYGWRFVSGTSHVYKDGTQSLRIDFIYDYSSALRYRSRT